MSLLHPLHLMTEFTFDSLEPSGRFPHLQNGQVSAKPLSLNLPAFCLSLQTWAPPFAHLAIHGAGQQSLNTGPTGFSLHCSKVYYWRTFLIRTFLKVRKWHYLVSAVTPGILLRTTVKEIDQIHNHSQEVRKWKSKQWNRNVSRQIKENVI